MVHIRPWKLDQSLWFPPHHTHLLRVKGVDPRLHQHVGEDEVLQTRGSPRAAGLVVVLESLKEVCVRLLKLPFSEVHFPSTLWRMIHPPNTQVNKQLMGTHHRNAALHIQSCLQQ